jgi:hypothetical protein
MVSQGPLNGDDVRRSVASDEVSGALSCTRLKALSIGNMPLVFASFAQATRRLCVDEQRSIDALRIPELVRPPVAIDVRRSASL